MEEAVVAVEVLEAAAEEVTVEVVDVAVASVAAGTEEEEVVEAVEVASP